MLLVTLNRPLGATDRRFDDGNIYEMIIPTRNANGSFSAPKNIDKHSCGWAFKKYLNEGEIVLVNYRGGWNTLTKHDRILSLVKK